MKPESALLVRASISFPADIYQNLKNLAKQKKVSLAWVVREAAESYIADETAKGGEGQKATVRAVGKPKG
jgi:metal-responsive CopG/Arc/MetJ family transcriptional regulator